MMFTYFDGVDGVYRFGLNFATIDEKTNEVYFYGAEKRLLDLRYVGVNQPNSYKVLINRMYTYYTDIDGNLTIDITQMTTGRSNLRVEVFDDEGEPLDEPEITIAGGSYVSNFTCNVIPGIDPNDYAAFMPTCDTAGEIAGGYMGLGILPPNVIYMDTEFGDGIQLQVFNDFNNDIRYWCRRRAVEISITAKNNTIVIPYGADTLFTDDKYNENRAVWKLRELDDCKKYIMIQWATLAGQERRTLPDAVTLDDLKMRSKRAVFEVEKVTIEQRDVKALAIFGDGYRNTMTQGVTLTCKIDGLTAYGYAYYSDLLVSPKITAIMRAGEDIDSEMNECVIEGQKFEIAGTEDFRTFRFNLKFKHYANIYKW